MGWRSLILCSFMLVGGVCKAVTITTCAEGGNAISEACDNGGGYSGGGSGSSSDSNVRNAQRAIESFGEYMQQRDDEAKEQARIERLKADQEYNDHLQRERELGQKNNAEFEAEAEKMSSGSWRQRAVSEGQGSAGKRSVVECNCREVVGRCSASIKIVKKREVGVDYLVTSSESRCSKVSYYIENTPYLTVLNNKSSTSEHASGLKGVLEKDFVVERCEVCSRK